MPSDTEPRYRLVDSNGNVVGSLYAEADGTLKIQEGTSGSDNEVSVATDGTFSAPAVSTANISISDALDAVGLSISEDPNSPTVFISHTGTTNSSFATVSTSVTGDNSAQDIVDLTATGLNFHSGLINIKGVSDNSDTFSDLVNMANFTEFNVVNSETRVSPGNRTYSFSNGMFEVAIDDLGVTYDLSLTLIGGLI